MSKIISNALTLIIFTVSLVLFTVLTLDFINYQGQQSLFEMALWLLFGFITLGFGKIIVLLNTTIH